MRARRSLMFVGFLFAAGALLENAGAAEIKLDTLHDAAPLLAFHDANGKNAQLSDYHGKRVIVHFWASWCKPCLHELPELQKLVSTAKSKNIVFLPISGDDATHESDAKAFMESIPGKLPFWIATSSTSAYLTWGMPVTYFINEEGMIVARALGQKDWAKQTDLDHFLDQAFAGKAAK